MSLQFCKLFFKKFNQLTFSIYSGPAKSLVLFVKLNFGSSSSLVPKDYQTYSCLIWLIHTSFFSFNSQLPGNVIQLLVWPIRVELQQHITNSVVFSCEYVVHETQTDPPVVAKTFRRSQRFISSQGTVILLLTYYYEIREWNAQWQDTQSCPAGWTLTHLGTGREKGRLKTTWRKTVMKEGEEMGLTWSEEKAKV